MHACCYEPRNVGDVRHQERTNFIGNGAETREVNDARIRRVAADDHLRFARARDGGNRVVVEQLCRCIKVVLRNLVEGA